MAGSRSGVWCRPLVRNGNLGSRYQPLWCSRASRMDKKISKSDNFIRSLMFPCFDVSNNCWVLIISHDSDILRIVLNEAHELDEGTFVKIITCTERLAHCRFMHWSTPHKPGMAMHTVINTHQHCRMAFVYVRLNLLERRSPSGHD